jgi:hypothetical protein
MQANKQSFPDRSPPLIPFRDAMPAETEVQAESGKETQHYQSG